MTNPTPTTPTTPTTKDELYRDGLERFSAGDLDGAIERLELALAIDPTYVEALRTIAMAWFRKGDFVRALAFGERNVAADPKDIVAHSSLSLFLMKNGRVKDAEDVAAKARLMAWKRQLKDGPGGDAQGLTILEKPAVVESQPIMPLMPLMPPRAVKPAPAASEPAKDAAPPGTGGG